MGINTFCLGPTVIGDCIINGGELCPLGEKAGVADRDEPRETRRKM